MIRLMRRASAALAILVTTGAAAACALDAQGSATSEAEPIEAGIPIVKESGTQLEASPIPIADSTTPDDTSADDVPVIPPQDSGVGIDTSPPPLCNAVPKGLSVWLHGGLAYDDALHTAPLTPRGTPTTQTASDGGISLNWPSQNDSVAAFCADVRSFA